MTIVRYSWDNPPEVTQAQLDEVASIKEEDIDFSDIPELTDDFGKNAVRGFENRHLLMRDLAHKPSSIDVEVVEWLDKQSQETQRYFNYVLKEMMKRQQKVCGE